MSTYTTTTDIFIHVTDIKIDFSSGFFRVDVKCVHDEQANI